MLVPCCSHSFCPKALCRPHAHRTVNGSTCRRRRVSMQRGGCGLKIKCTQMSSTNCGVGGLQRKCKQHSSSAAQPAVLSAPPPRWRGGTHQRHPLSPPAPLTSGASPSQPRGNPTYTSGCLDRPLQLPEAQQVGAPARLILHASGAIRGPGARRSGLRRHVPPPPPPVAAAAAAGHLCRPLVAAAPAFAAHPTPSHRHVVCRGPARAPRLLRPQRAGRRRHRRGGADERRRGRLWRAHLPAPGRQGGGVHVAGGLAHLRGGAVRPRGLQVGGSLPAARNKQRCWAVEESAEPPLQAVWPAQAAPHGPPPPPSCTSARRQGRPRPQPPQLSAPRSPILLFQSVYKTIFFFASTLPALRRRKPADKPAIKMGGWGERGVGGCHAHCPRRSAGAAPCTLPDPPLLLRTPPRRPHLRAVWVARLAPACCRAAAAVLLLCRVLTAAASASALPLVADTFILPFFLPWDTLLEPFRQ